MFCNVFAFSLGKSSENCRPRPDVQWVEACVYQGDTIPFVQFT